MHATGPLLSISSVTLSGTEADRAAQRHDLPAVCRDRRGRHRPPEDKDELTSPRSDGAQALDGGGAARRGRRRRPACSCSRARPRATRHAAGASGRDSAVTSTTTATTQAPSAEPVKVVLARIARDPFASGVPKLSSKPARASRPSSSSTAVGRAHRVDDLDLDRRVDGLALTRHQRLVLVVERFVILRRVVEWLYDLVEHTDVSSTHSDLDDRLGDARAPRPITPPRSSRGRSTRSSVRFGKDLAVPVKTNIARLTPLPNVMAARR